MLDFPDPPERRPTQVAAAETPGLRSLLTVAVMFVVIAGLYLGRAVLIPLTLAVLLSFLLAPLVNLLRRGHLGRVPSVLLAVMMALLVILGIGGLIGTQLAGLAADLPRYELTVQEKIATVQRLVLSHVATFTRALVELPGSGVRSVIRPGTTAPADTSGGTPAGTGAQAGTGAPTRTDTPARSGTPAGTGTQAGTPAAAPGGPAQQKPIPVEVRQPDPTVMQIMQQIVTPVVEPLSTTIVVLIVSIFILLQREDLRDRMIRLFGSRDLHRTTIAMNDAARRLSRYLLTQLVVNASFGVIVGTGLAFIGIPSPVIWGVLGALLRFVPYIGAPLSAVMPLALAAAVAPGWSKLLWTGALYLTVEPIMSQAVEPLVYGRSTGLSPFAVVLSATFWTWLWGPIGLIVSTPLTLCLVVVGRHVARLQFLDVLLGDRPALTPVESFYQRLLAGDPDEAHDQAEILLKDRPLCSYYDNVALSGLRLAMIDAERGAMTPAHLERIKLSVQSLIEDLDDHEDRDPSQGATTKSAGTKAGKSPPCAEHDRSGGPGTEDAAPSALDPASEWRSATPVLCIAGRGVLDEAASMMLAQLLEKQGFATRLVVHAATTRSAIGALDTSGVAMVCLSYLDLAGSPSHLRYLLQRLRRRLPADVPVLVGLWPAEDSVLLDERVRTAVGADYYTTSLHDTVETCLKVAREAQGNARPTNARPTIEAAAVMATR